MLEAMLGTRERCPSDESQIPGGDARRLAMFFLLGWMSILGCSPGPAKQHSVSSKDVPSKVPAINSSKESGQTPEKASSRFLLEDRSKQLELNFAYQNDEDSGLLSIVESLGGGVAVFDFDKDGNQDVMAAGGGTFENKSTTRGVACGLFRNSGTRFESVTAMATVVTELYSHGVCVADYNHDGYGDVLITGYNGLVLLENMGDGTFQHRPDNGFPVEPGWCTSAAWADFNQDGALDLYVARYVDWSFSNHPVCYSSVNGERDICPPKSFLPLPDLLLISNQHGRFLESANRNGLRKDGKGLGVLAVDIDNDSDIDVYVANDTTDNFLYLNDGVGQFNEVGLLHGVAVDDRSIPNGSMGVAAGDFDENGWIDLWVTNYERESNAMYQNQGQGLFQHVSRRVGVTTMGGGFVGFGTEFCDLDMDGRSEILVTNGHVVRFPSAAPLRQLPLILTLQDGRFIKQFFPSENYFGAEHQGRGLATGDMNGDGTVDVVISHLSEPVALLMNSTVPVSPPFAFQLVGSESNRDAIGARVVARIGETEINRQIVGGGSYLSTSERTIRIPTFGSSKCSLKIYWPGQSTPQLLNITSQGGVVTIVQPLP